ncbi:Selenoo [Scenedesmus sp. PABB004]|nr:Selenoo [Scenedesmus sp. PABB004]
MSPVGNPSLFMRFFGLVENFPLYGCLAVACGLAAYTPIKHLTSAADIALDGRARNFGDNLASNPRYEQKARHYYDTNKPLITFAHIKDGEISVVRPIGVPSRPQVGDGVNFPARWQPRIPDSGSMAAVAVPGPHPLQQRQPAGRPPQPLQRAAAAASAAAPAMAAHAPPPGGVPLEGLAFVRPRVLEDLHVDDGEQTTPRPVRGACYARVRPTPLRAVELVAASPDALAALLGLDPAQAGRPEFVAAMAGNALLPGMDPAAHCYAGYQFGSFAGQLGDGAAILLGEAVHPATGQRVEVQLKGAGLTPFSRSADGRKVLRSSLREFLASEAMDALGVPTTRAGSLVVSREDSVLRDVHYTGDARPEPCAVVSRLAASFVRFGSFEVCKPPDPVTGRAGPSAGLAGALLPALLGHVLCRHHPALWAYYGGAPDDPSMAGLSDTNVRLRGGGGGGAARGVRPRSAGNDCAPSRRRVAAGSSPPQVQDMVGDWFAEVCRATARLVSAWQGLGFVHGVLNTGAPRAAAAARAHGSAPARPHRRARRRRAAVCAGPSRPDNMSVLGLTLDYGPFAFMDRFDRAHVSNGSDDAARYTYEAQPEICRWNCERLAAALAAAPLPGAADGGVAADGGGAADGDGGGGHGSLLPPARAKAGLAAYDAEYARSYRAHFRRKLGLLGRDGADAAARAEAAHGVGAAADAAAAEAAAVAAAAALPPGGEPPPSWPLAADAPPGVAAAAAAVSRSGESELDAGDDALIADLLAVMHDTGADWTNTWRALSQVAMPPPSPAQANGAADGGGEQQRVGCYASFLAALLPRLASPAEMAAASKPRMPAENVQMLSMLAGRDAALLHMLGLTPGAVAAAVAGHKAAARWAGTAPAAKAEADAAAWARWLARYVDRLQAEADVARPSPRRPRPPPLCPLVAHTARRAAGAAAGVMAATNPRITLRNWVAQHAIDAAARRDYGEVARLLAHLRAPFVANGPMTGAAPACDAAAAAGAGAGGGGGGEACPLVRVDFDGPPPAWAARLCIPPAAAAAAARAPAPPPAPCPRAARAPGQVLCYVLGSFVAVSFAAYALAYGWWWSHRRAANKDTEDFVTARSTQSMWRIGWSFYAGAVGSWAIVTPSQYASFAGIVGVAIYALSCGLPILMIAGFGGRMAADMPHVFSLSDFVGWRYGPIAKTVVFLITTFIMCIFVLAEYTTIGSLFAEYVGSVAWGITLLIGALTLTYTAYGGLAVSIATDQAQGIASALLAAVMVAYVAATYRARLPSPLPAELGPNREGYLSIFTLPASLIASTMLNEAFWQRVWASADRRALLGGGGIGFCAIVVLIFLSGFGGWLALAGGYVGPGTNPNLYLMQILGPRGGSGLVESWVGVVVVLLAVVMNEGAVDSLQNGLAAGLSGQYLKARPLLWTRIAVVVLNVPLLVIATRGFEVLSLFLVGNLLACCAIVPLVVGLIPPARRHFGETGFVAGVAGGVLALTGAGVGINWTPGDAAGSFSVGARWAWYDNAYDWRAFAAALVGSAGAMLLTDGAAAALRAAGVEGPGPAGCAAAPGLQLAEPKPAAAPAAAPGSGAEPAPAAAV